MRLFTGIHNARAVAGKLSENDAVMSQMRNNSREQALLGDFPQALDDAILDTTAAQHALMMQLLADPSRNKCFAEMVFDMLWRKGAD